MAVALEERDAHVIVVDDQVINLDILSAILTQHFHVHPFADAEAVLRYVESGGRVDLFLLDVMMPGIGGYELCRRLQSIRGVDAPVIFLTALNTTQEEEFGLNLGAVDFIVKPVSPPVVLARVRNHIRLAKAIRLIRLQNDALEQRVAVRTLELKRKTDEAELQAREVAAVKDAMVVAFSSLAEFRDSETGAHILRTQIYVRELAREIQHRPRFDGMLSDDDVETLYRAAPLHDIGKVAIPDRILLKPGPLTPQEFDIMKTHTLIGRNFIAGIETRLSSQSPVLSFARQIAFSHHERWDGSGYPQGLVKEEAPLPARIMAVADVYDALTSKRVYKPAFAHDEAVGIMVAGRGKHFDPDILDAFLTLQDQFRRIALEHRDRCRDDRKGICTL